MGAKTKALRETLNMLKEERMKRAREQRFNVDERMYHGSPRNIERFDNRHSNAEGHYGGHHYFTSDPADASDNYASVSGPDLSNRIELEKERLQDIEDYDLLDAAVDVYGERFDDIDDIPDQDRVLEHIARETLGIENQGTVYPTYLRGNFIKPDTHRFEYDVEYDDDGDVISEGGPALDLIEMVREKAYDWNIDEQTINEALQPVYDEMVEGEITADTFERAIRENLTDVYDDMTGEMASPGAFIADVYQGMGFDGIDMDTDVFANRFGFAGVRLPGMAHTGGGTRHTIVFDPKNIRSINAAFDPEKTDSSNLLASAAPVAAGTAAAAGMMAPEDAQANWKRMVLEGAQEVFDPRYDPRKLETPRMTGVRGEYVERGTQDAPELSWSDLEGQPFITSMSDRTRAGAELVNINDVDLARPIDLRGGQGYMFENPGSVWASGKGPVTGMMNEARKAKQATGKDPLFIPWRMAPSGGDFATMTGETMLSFAHSNMNKRQKRDLDKMLKKILPGWPGIDHPDAVFAFRSSKDKDRKLAKDQMDKHFRDDGGLSKGQARLLVSDPKQLAAPDGGVQNVGRVHTDVDPYGMDDHPSYPYALPGEGVGQLPKDHVNIYELLPHLVKERGIDDPTNPARNHLRSLEMGAKSGVITDEVLRKLEARGVDVKLLPAATLVSLASLLESEEAEARTKYGLGGAMEIDVNAEREGLQRWADTLMGIENRINAGVDYLNELDPAYLGSAGKLINFLRPSLQGVAEVAEKESKGQPVGAGEKALSILDLLP